MPETYLYLPLTGVVPVDLAAGTNVLVQVFLDPKTNTVISAQLATRVDRWETWSEPTDLIPQ